MSDPTLPINAVLEPNLDAHANTFAGAPPGFCSNNFVLPSLLFFIVKSISNSPIAEISYLSSSTLKFSNSNSFSLNLDKISSYISLSSVWSTNSPVAVFAKLKQPSIDFALKIYLPQTISISIL